MNLRVKQTEATREIILDAAHDLIFSDADPNSITIQAIADAAGVSHRTMYRHFDSRQALLAAVGQRMDADSGARFALEQPITFDGWIDSVQQTMEFGAAFRERLRRAWAMSATTSVWRKDRDEAYYEMFRARFPHLDEETAFQDFVALRHLLGSSSVVLIGERFDMSPEQVAVAVERAVQALVADIAKRDRKAAADG